MHNLRFRQIHLDFHTSIDIDGIGEKFNKEKWQNTLKLGHVDSITIFSKCHHGLSYHPTKVGKMHPNLKFDLLKAQYEACKEIGVNAPIYISVGWDVLAATEHPEWRCTGYNEKDRGYSGGGLTSLWQTMCFHSPYIEYLAEQTKEVVEIYPNCDGIFFDIILQKDCVCPHCLKWMYENNLNPELAEDRKKCGEHAMLRYYETLTAAAKSTNPDMPVFHNSGHIDKSKTDILKYFSHLEIESLPTTGWGYDHFPVSAKYTQNLGYDFLGMTGKFHTSWGEFGGYKHPNALRYECAQMIAFNAKCSIGDQLHPNGDIDESTYGIIGKAYKEVEEKEPWCIGTKPIAEIGVLSQEAETGVANADTGVGRVLLEGKYLWDLINRDIDFNKYKLLILADKIKFDADLKTKVDNYLAQGGKLLLTGKSGLWKDKDEFAVDFGATYYGENPLQSDYIVGKEELELDYVKSPIVMYLKSEQVKANAGRVLSDIYNPYFSRSYKKWCSHQHTPYTGEVSEYAGSILNKNIMYLAHPIFDIYWKYSAVVYKEYAMKAIDLLLGEKALITNLPSVGKVSLMDQEDQNRYILHLLYANTISRGEPGQNEFNPDKPVWDHFKVEVIEELITLHDISVKVKFKKPIKSITLALSKKELPMVKDGDYYDIKLNTLNCHEMIVFNY